MNKRFDKYFKIYVQRMEQKFIEFPVPIRMYDTDWKPVDITKVQVSRSHDDKFYVSFTGQTENGNFFMCHEDGILTPEEVGPNKTTLGRLLYG